MSASGEITLINILWASLLLLLLLVQFIFSGMFLGKAEGGTGIRMGEVCLSWEAGESFRGVEGIFYITPRFSQKVLMVPSADVRTVWQKTIFLMFQGLQDQESLIQGLT